IGDFLFVSKISYGPKIPNTPIAFPFSHHTLPMTEFTKSYLEWISLPYYRFPGFTDIKNNDVVVFNYPDGDTVALQKQTESYYALVRHYGRQFVWSNYTVTARPVDKRENYIKRCIGIPGDKLEIKDGTVFVNGAKAGLPEKIQYNYVVKTKTGINPKTLEKLDIIEGGATENTGEYILTLTNEAITALKSYPYVLSIDRLNQPKGEWDPDIFPYDSTLKWNRDNFGPIVLPKAGATVQINKSNIALYTRIIDIYEGNDLKIDGDKILINGKVVTSYTFKMDYYWMMGDNRHNSADSRYWGFVPLDHIVGKAVFVWLSLDQNKTLFDGKIRWSKMFRIID
ncbi:MAG: signal peptidase I, partial [Bacteroidetes bacterium]|nr:signal peptidase I [Bacteroidota bacterium]